MLAVLLRCTNSPVHHILVTQKIGPRTKSLKVIEPSNAQGFFLKFDSVDKVQN